MTPRGEGWLHTLRRGRAFAAGVVKLGGLVGLTSCQLISDFDDLPLTCPNGMPAATLGDETTCESLDGGGGAGGRRPGGAQGAAGAGGAPSPLTRTPVSLGTYVRRLRDDAATVPSDDRAEIVYVDLHAVYNSELYSNDELVAFGDVVLKLLNSLDVASTSAHHDGAAIVADDGGVPLAVRFDARSFNLDKQRDVLGVIARLAGRRDADDLGECDIPVIPALDFLYVASSDTVFNVFGGAQGTYESGYSNIVLRRLLEEAGVLAPGQLVFEPVGQLQLVGNKFVNVSPTVGAFDLLGALDPVGLSREALDAMYSEDGASGRLWRGCLLNSGVSAGTRCIDRLAPSDPGGDAIYLSFDALNSSDVTRDVFAAAFVGPNNPAGDPLMLPQGDIQPFEIDGGEGFFRLKNSMFGYFSFNPDFQLVSDAPLYKTSLEDLELGLAGTFSGAACTWCHGDAGIVFSDAVWPTVSDAASGGGIGNYGFASKVAQEQSVWDAAFDLDWESYVKALRTIYALQGSTETNANDGVVLQLYRNDLRRSDIVAELGLASDDELDARLSDLPALRATLSQEGVLPREQFTRYYQALVDQAPLGDQDFLRGCVARQLSDVDR